MKKSIFIIVIISIIALMFLSNPSMTDYQAFLRQEILKESRKNTESPFGHAIGALVGGFAAELAVSQTIRDDYLLFSVYELSFNKKQLKVIGILKNFIILEAQ